MHFASETEGIAAQIGALFEDSFSASEGAEEGRVLKTLVSGLMTQVAPADLRVFLAIENDVILGVVFFSRMRFEQDPRTVFILSPAAVSPPAQGQGVGQHLVSHALSKLHAEGVDIVLTYGDIAFYSKTGFQHIAAADVPPPQPLSFPEGWLGQVLGDAPFAPLKGPSHCVGPLNDPSIW